jgi:glycerol kinase
MNKYLLQPYPAACRGTDRRWGFQRGVKNSPLVAVRANSFRAGEIKRGKIPRGLPRGFLLAIDQGTTSSRAIIFSTKGEPKAQHQLEFKQYFPQDAWVEHDPEEIWHTTLTCMRAALKLAKLDASDIAAIGIANQRETVVVWDKKTGEVIAPAIVWQDRRTADECQQLAAQKDIVNMVNEKTGLLIDPYFSATKIKWLLEHIPNAKIKAKKGELAFGTIDSFLLWRLTGGKQHKTDASNAARTLLFNIHTQQWDQALLDLFEIPLALLPTVEDSAADFGMLDKTILGSEIPITGVAGDQQAATIGQACFKAGMVKSTYGTGCFMFMNTGSTPVVSNNKLLTTVAYRLNNHVTYGLEGSIFIAGAAVQWLRDALHLIKTAKDTADIADEIPNNGNVYLVPAFTGLGAPYWDPHARGALIGLTRDTGIAHIVRAALEAVCYQTYDLLTAMLEDYNGYLQTLRVDGGMVENDWLLQFLADILQIEVQRSGCIQTSALGAAYLAGLGVGIYKSLDEVAKLWQPQQCFSPQMTVADRDHLHAGWRAAVSRIVD